MTHTITEKTYIAPGPQWKKDFCKLTLDNGKTIVSIGEAARTLNQHNVGDKIIVGKDVLLGGRFGE